MEIDFGSEFTEADINDLRTAKARLENPGLAARMADLFGKPIDAGLRALPQDWNRKALEIARKVLLKALEFAVRTLGNPEPGRSRDRLHRIWSPVPVLWGEPLGWHLFPWSSLCRRRSCFAPSPTSRAARVTTSRRFLSGFRAWRSSRWAAAARVMTRLKKATGWSGQLWRNQSPRRSPTSAEGVSPRRALRRLSVLSPP